MFKKELAVAVVVLFLGISVIPVVVSDTPTNRIIYVDDDAPPEWYDATHVQTIQEGIDVASDGDTIFIYNGVYQPSSNIHVYKELIIRGENKDTVIVEKETGSEELSIRAKNVEVSTITFKNFGITNQGKYDNATITNNIFIIDYEEKYWNPDVIHIVGENNEISNNIMTFTGTYDGGKTPITGIFIRCYQSNITNNIITGVGSGPYTALDIFDLDWSYQVDDLVKGGKNIIEGNTFSNNGCGICLTPTLRPGYNSRIVHNNFIGNKVNAMFIVPFIVSLIPVVDIIRNNIKRLIYLADSSDTDDSFSSGLSLNYWDENYWDDWKGFGSKYVFGLVSLVIEIPNPLGPGVIIIPINIPCPWICFDHHPASEPYDIPTPEVL